VLQEYTDRRMTTTPPAAQTIRVAVGGDGPQTGVWTIWSHGTDTYLTERKAGTVGLKVSLHPSDRPDAHHLKVHGLGMFGAWPAPAPFGQGASVLYRIYFPTAELGRVYNPETTKPITLIDPAPDGHMVVVVVYRTAPGVTLSNPPGLPTGIAASWQLPDDHWISVACHDVAYPSALAAIVAQGRQHVAAGVADGSQNLVGGAGSIHHRTIVLTGHVPDGDRVAYAFDARGGDE
jgi:hypothetical protein